MLACNNTLQQTAKAMQKKQYPTRLALAHL